MVELSLRDPGQVSLYVCGPTVYDDPHLGHGRFALVWDVLRRYLEWSGLSVRFVSNVTDVDDKIIARARRDGTTPAEVAQRYEEVWYRTMDALGVRRPDHDPHATAYVAHMVELVEQLVGKGIAYETSDGVYFDVDGVDDYGALARQPLETLRAGARVDVVEEKRSALDFALWKKSEPDRPEGDPEWPSPWGPGRPGWHTECVVMALDLLGEGFDLHGGGIDLAFPHHENERVQAEAVGREFARRWVHSGFVVGPGGSKMSKSLGNYTSLVDLLDRNDPRAYRLLVLQSHYRAPLEVGPGSIERAERSLERLDELARRAAGGTASPDPAALETFRSHMDDDLGTPAATGLLFELVAGANAGFDAGDTAAGASLAAAAMEIAGVLGLGLRSGDERPDEEAARLMAERDAARAGRDFARADAIREELVGRGWTVKDTPEGTKLQRRRGGPEGPAAP